MAKPTKSDLQALDYDWFGEPFADVEAKSLSTESLDVAYFGEPFVGATAGGANVELTSMTHQMGDFVHHPIHDIELQSMSHQIGDFAHQGDVTVVGNRELQSMSHQMGDFVHTGNLSIPGKGRNKNTTKTRKRYTIDDETYFFTDNELAEFVKKLKKKNKRNAVQVEEIEEVIEVSGEPTDEIQQTDESIEELLVDAPEEAININVEQLINQTLIAQQQLLEKQRVERIQQELQDEEDLMMILMNLF